MRKVLLVLTIAFVIFNSQLIFAQLQGQAIVDSLLKELPKMKEDTNKVKLLDDIAREYLMMRTDKGLPYAKKQLELAKKLNWKRGIAIAYGSLGAQYHTNSEYSKSLESHLNSFKYNEELGNISGMAASLLNAGQACQDLSEYPKALGHYFNAMKYFELLDDKDGLLRVYNSIFIVYNYQLDYKSAIKYIELIGKLSEELGDKDNLAGYYTNYGLLSARLKNYDIALEYQLKALQLNEEIGNKYAVAGNLNNLGNNCLDRDDLKSALEYYFQALDLNTEMNNINWRSRNLSNISNIYYLAAKGETEGAKHLLARNFKDNISSALEKSMLYNDSALVIRERMGDIQALSGNYQLRSQIQSLKGDHKQAFDSYVKYTALQDSIFSIDKEKEIANLESKRELEIKEKENLLLIKDNQLFNAELLQKNQKISLAEKEKEVQHLAFLKEQAERQEKEKQLSLSEIQMKLQKSQIESLDKEKEKQNSELKAKNLQRNFFIAGVIVFIVMFLIAFIRFREKKKLSEELAKQKEEIENQKIIVESQKELVEGQKEVLQEKNEQIYASITYASTIQHAILPWESTLKNAFNDILIFYKPKDIVSGDSYWFQEVEGIKFLAAIDCTGHGTPGAMLTVIASTALDDAVLGKRLSDPAEILTYINEKVTDILNQRLSENQTRDGMEVAMIAIHLDKIQFSGAGRPLYLKNGTLEIIKTDKRGIAGSTKNDEYQFNSIEIKKSENIILYLTTDGFADQMNEDGKKYSTRRFLALLESIADNPLSEQYEILNTELAAHQGNKHQIDDITIIGVRI